MTQAMIFCRTNLDCDNLEKFLNKNGGNGKKFSGKLEKGMVRQTFNFLYLK